MQSDGTIFGYFKTRSDLRSAVAGTSKEEVNERWQKMIAPCFEPLEGSQPDEMMQEVEEVFHFD